MLSSRKVILYIACSVDGFIAREDGEIDWLSIVERKGEDYGYREFIDTVDTVIMGRKTYDKVLSFGIGFPHSDKECYVITSSRQGKDANVTFYNGKIADLISRLRKRDGKNIFIDGGSEIVALLRSQGLIDEYVISILPLLLGKGIRLFKDVAEEEQLRLVGHRTFASGLVQLSYRRED